jgi:glycosyltransferase involved in cell wall biosynthesis
LRILHVTPSFYPAWAYGGVPRCAYELCRSLVQLDVEVSVWTTDARDENRRIEERATVVDGISVRRFPNLSNGLAYHRQLYLPRGLWRHALAHAADFDVIHIHSHRHLLELMVGLAARHSDLRYVFTGHGTVPPIERYVRIKKILDVLSTKRFLRSAAVCIAVSQAEVSHYRKMGVEQRRIVVIPDGIRLDEFSRLPPKGTFRAALQLGDGPLIVFVGKITPRKGVDVLLRALARLPESVKLAVCGNFMMADEPIRRLVRELGIDRRVLFTGLVFTEDRNSAYVDADVVAYPSVDEIFGLVPAEALMCGAPVVVCEDSGCGEVVRAADAGLLVPYGDVEALTNALQRLLADPALRRRYATNGRRYIEEHLSWNSVAAETIAVYRQVYREHPRKSG